MPALALELALPGIIAQRAGAGGAPATAMQAEDGDALMAEDGSTYIEQEY